MKTSYLVAVDVEQVVNKYSFLDVLVCGIAEHFCELCRILTSPYGKTPLPKCFTTEQCFEASLFVKNVFNLIIKGGDLRLTLTD